MNTLKFAKFAPVAVVLAALLFCLVIPFRAFAGEDATKGICTGSPEHEKCKADLTTCQGSAKDLKKELDECNKILKPFITPTTSTTPSVTAKPIPKATASVTAKPVPAVVKPKCDACKDIDDLKKEIKELKKRLVALEELVAEHAKHKTGDDDAIAELQKQIAALKKRLDDLVIPAPTDLSEIEKRLGDLEKRGEKLSGTRLAVDASVHGVGDFFPGSPAQHYGVEAKVSGTFFPDGGRTGFIAGAGFGLLWGSKWVEDRAYRVSPFAGVEACTAQNRRTCFQVTGVFNIYTWAGRANDPQLPPTLRNKFETSFGWAFGLGVGIKHHFTKGLWIGFDVTPKVTPGKNSWSFASNGSPVVVESKGFGIDLGVGLGGTIDVF